MAAFCVRCYIGAKCLISADPDYTLKDVFLAQVKPRLAEDLPDHSDVAVVTSSAGKNGTYVEGWGPSEKVHLILEFG